MSEAAEFIDLTLQREASLERAVSVSQRSRGMRCYGASVGAIRGAVRDAGRKFPGLSPDEITALSSELWGCPVFERRLAAVVLLLTNVTMLRNSDLTRLEGFVREARSAALVDPLAVDLVGPLINGMTGPLRARAESILDRWGQDPDPWLRRASLLSSLRGLRAGDREDEAFLRRARVVVAHDDDAIIGEALAVVRRELATNRPELMQRLGGPGGSVK